MENTIITGTSERPNFSPVKSYKLSSEEIAEKFKDVKPYEKNKNPNPYYMVSYSKIAARKRNGSVRYVAGDIYV